ncbi:hypothetical protein Q8344_005314 [Vibrio harveyi]|nr:hypothetical protein [Vibrio harveyi]
MTFLLCVGLSDQGGMRRHRYCVAHTLTGRYAFWEKICSFTKQMNIRHLVKTCIVSTNLR